MAFPTPPKLTTAIPNNPFYTPQAWQVCGSYLNYTVSCGICVTPEGNIETWDCGAGIAGVVSGNGICTTTIDGIVEICNTGILGISPGVGLSSSGGQDPILYLAQSGVNPGVYTYPSITVDQYGRVTAAAARPPTIRCDVITAKGDLLVGEASQTATALPVGSNLDIIVADSSCALGMKWFPQNQLPFVKCCCYPSKGYLVAGSATANTPISLPPGANGCVLTACSTCATGMVWGCVPPAVPAPYQYSQWSMGGQCSSGIQFNTPTSAPQICSIIVFPGVTVGPYPFEMTVVFEIQKFTTDISYGCLYTWASGSSECSGFIHWSNPGQVGSTCSWTVVTANMIFRPAPGVSDFGFDFVVSCNVIGAGIKGITTKWSASIKQLYPFLCSYF